MQQVEIFSGFTEDEAKGKANDWLSQQRLAWTEVDLQYEMAGTAYDDGTIRKIVYRYSILVRYKTTNTFQGGTAWKQQ